MAQSIAESLLDTLADAGASCIFGVTGDALNPLLEAIRKDDRFRWVTFRHEENAAYAASAYAELTGGIGVCAGTAGPGALHLINGLYNAKMEGAGVVAITGQVPRGLRGSEYHKEMDLEKVFGDACHYQAIIDSPASMPRMAEIAVQKALVERQVTRIEIPIDVISGEATGGRFKRPVVKQLPRAVPTDDLLDEAARVLASGERVTLFCGIGCRPCRSDVLALADKLGAPVAHTLRAKDVFDCTERGPVMGMTGLIGNPAGYHAVSDCDVLLMLGTDFPYDEFMPDGRPIIQVDHAPDHIGRRAPVTLGLVGDVGETVRALLPRVEDRKASAPFRDKLVGMRDKWLEQMQEQGSLTRTDEPLHPQLFARAISDRAAPDAIIAQDVGNCTIWYARQMDMQGERRAAGGFNHGSLGGGLPIALGAAAAFPGRQVWCLAGDGGFGMSMNDFVTAVRYEWPVKVVVFNNSDLAFVTMEMEVAGLPRSEEATGLTNPDFAAYAKACGGDGVKVEHAADIVPAIEAAIASPKPFIIDAVTSSGELSFPPHIELEQAWGFGISKVKEALMGIKGDHEIWDHWRDQFKASLG